MTFSNELTRWLDLLRGKPCWHVNGASVYPTLGFQFGGRVRMEKPLPRAPHDSPVRQHQGEFRMIVWSSWRLDGPGGAITSSDQEQENIIAKTAVLTDRTVERADVRAPAWDLLLHFAGGYVLNVFCDHVKGDCSTETNWELWQGDRALIVGPSHEWSIYEPKTTSKV
jgi:hypothetical protein